LLQTGDLTADRREALELRTPDERGDPDASGIDLKRIRESPGRRNRRLEQ